MDDQPRISYGEDALAEYEMEDHGSDLELYDDVTIYDLQDPFYVPIGMENWLVRHGFYTWSGLDIDFRPNRGYRNRYVVRDFVDRTWGTFDSVDEITVWLLMLSDGHRPDGYDPGVYDEVKERVLYYVQRRQASE
jgi:hypothetical protein